MYIMDYTYIMETYENSRNNLLVNVNRGILSLCKMLYTIVNQIYQYFPIVS